MRQNGGGQSDGRKVERKIVILNMYIQCVFKSDGTVGIKTHVNGHEFIYTKQKLDDEHPT